MTQKDYKGLAKNKLGVEFNDLDLLLTAFTHRSYLNEHRKSTKEHNERLEFLGDAVLDFVISKALFDARPDAREGDLSKLRSSLVKDTTLAAIAQELELGDHLVLGSGERKSGGHRRESILADALEAIFGASSLRRLSSAATADLHLSTASGNQ